MLYPKLLCNINELLPLYFRRLITTSCKYKSHYDTLKVTRESSYTDIRNAYLKLSKQYHPDRNKDESSHKEFVKISEAYNILSKSSSRRNYDLGLQNPACASHMTTDRRTDPQRTDETFWENRDRSKDSYYQSEAYYGVRGIKKVSNMFIAFICLGFTMIGIVIQICFIRNSVTLRRENMKRRSAELENQYSEMRAKALENGNLKQLELFKENLKKKKEI